MVINGDIQVTDWFKDEGVTILIIVVVSYLITRFVGMLISRVVRKALTEDSFASAEAERRREDTIIGILSTTVKVIVWVLSVILIIGELGVDIGPLVAGAGVAGLALAFGAQALIKDFLSGVFIVLENQYRVGDVIEVNGASGVVEAITIRTTVLRDLDGDVHHIPNGIIEHTTNKTLGFSRINMNIGVSYDSDIEKVEKIVNEIGVELANDKKWSKEVVKAPHFLRVDSFDDSAVTVKILGDVKPGSQWGVAGEFRRRLKKAFDKEGIEIPFPQRVIHNAKK